MVQWCSSAPLRRFYVSHVFIAGYLLSIEEMKRNGDFSDL